jgi:hypothetical protein
MGVSRGPSIRPAPLKIVLRWAGQTRAGLLSGRIAECNLSEAAFRDALMSRYRRLRIEGGAFCYTLALGDRGGNVTELLVADSGSEYCECCKRRMVQWNSALQPHYRLVERFDRNHL